MRNLLTDIFTKYENSEFYKKRLIKNLKPSICPGVKSQDELIFSLNKYFDFVTVNINEVDRIFWEISMLGNLCNKDLNDLDFKIYKIINNSRSNLIYENENWDKFIVFESSNDFFISNSQIVQLIILVELGVSKSDYRMETPELINYLRIYNEYKKVFKNQK